MGTSLSHHDLARVRRVVEQTVRAELTLHAPRGLDLPPPSRPRSEAVVCAAVLRGVASMQELDLRATDVRSTLLRAALSVHACQVEHTSRDALVSAARVRGPRVAQAVEDLLDRVVVSDLQRHAALVAQDSARRALVSALERVEAELRLRWLTPRSAARRLVAIAQALLPDAGLTLPEDPEALQ